MPRSTKSFPEPTPAPTPTAPTPTAPIPCTMPGGLAPTRFVGCDVGKASIVVFDTSGGRTCTIANRPEVLGAFVAGLDATCLIVCEATGGYEDALLAAAIAAGVAAHRADARKVKAFIRSFGTLGKTDALDAKALATYAQERHLRLARRKIAALAGLAPHPNQSGAKDAARHVRGGRPDIKTILFMPTLSAVRHDPALSAAHKRLIAAGKKKMVAIVAIMRKLLVIANARLRDAFAQDSAQDNAQDSAQGNAMPAAA